MTEQGPDPRFDPLPPAIPGTCEPRVARDIRTRMLVSRGSRAGERAHRHAPRPDRVDVARVPASDHARHDTPYCTRAVSRSPRPPPRTSDGTRYTYGAYPGACLASCSYPPRWITIPPPQPSGSRGGVDHDPAAKWISTRPPLKAVHCLLASSSCSSSRRSRRAAERGAAPGPAAQYASPRPRP